jgi:hypothetical protein
MLEKNQTELVLLSIYELLASAGLPALPSHLLIISSCLSLAFPSVAAPDLLLLHLTHQHPPHPQYAHIGDQQRWFFHVLSFKFHASNFVYFLTYLYFLHNYIWRSYYSSTKLAFPSVLLTLLPVFLSRKNLTLLSCIYCLSFFLQAFLPYTIMSSFPFPHTGISYLIVFPFIVLHMHCIIYKLAVCGHPA